LERCVVVAVWQSGEAVSEQRARKSKHDLMDVAGARS
jgi:hypothetical protein